MLPLPLAVWVDTASDSVISPVFSIPLNYYSVCTDMPSILTSLLYQDITDYLHYFSRISALYNGKAIFCANLESY